MLKFSHFHSSPQSVDKPVSVSYTSQLEKCSKVRDNSLCRLLFCCMSVFVLDPGLHIQFDYSAPLKMSHTGELRKWLGSCSGDYLANSPENESTSLSAAWVSHSQNRSQQRLTDDAAGGCGVAVVVQAVVWRSLQSVVLKCLFRIWQVALTICTGVTGDPFTLIQQIELEWPRLSLSSVVPAASCTQRTFRLHLIQCWRRKHTENQSATLLTDTSTSLSSLTISSRG